MSVFDGSAPMADHAVLCRLAHGMMTGIWTPYIPLVWVTNLQVYRESVALSYGIGAFGHGNYGGSGTETIGFPTPAVDVGSFSADGEEYTVRASIALVQANEKSYYFDQTNQLLYVQFGDGTKPSLHAAKLVGMLLYYSNKEVDIDNQHYAGKITEMAGIRKTKDSLDFGVQEFPEGSVSFINLDGEFDSVKERFFMYGAIIEFFLGINGAAFSDFRQMYKGYVGEFNYDREQARWSIFDDRKKLSREIPYNTFNQTTWSDLNEDHIGEYIPWAFGRCRRVPCICLNEDESTPSSYKFCVADCTDHPGGIQGIETVWVNDIVKTPASVQYYPDSDGIAFFTLSTDDYSPGNTVTANIKGFGTINLLNNSGCESTDQVTLLNGTAGLGNATFERSSERAHSGTYSHKVFLTSTGSIGLYKIVGETASPSLGLEGKTVTLSLWIYVPSVDGPALSEVIIQTGYYSGSWSHVDSGNPSAADTWVRLTTTVTIGSSYTDLRNRLRFANTVSNGEYVYIDDVQFEVAAAATDHVTRELWNNPIELEQHLLEEVSGIAYNSDNFDTDEWTAAKTNVLAQDVGRYIDERISVKDLIEEIQKSIMGTLFQKDNGKITNRIYDADRAISGTFVKGERFGDPAVSYDTTIATSIIVEYSKRYDTNKYKSTVYDTEEAEYAGLYKKYESRTFETLLTTAADAAVLALALFDYLKDEHRLILMTVPWQGIGVELCDIYNFPIERISATEPELVQCEIVEVEKRIIEGQIDLIGREVI